MNFGDLQHALRNLMQRGMRNPMGDRTQGLRDLLQQLRQQRRQNLDKFNLSSAFDDIQKRLEQILEKERQTLDDRMGGPQGDQDQQDPSASAGRSGEPADGDQSGESGGGEPGEQGSPQNQSGQQQGGRQQGGQRGQGQQGQSSQRGQQGQQGQSGSSDEQQFADMLKNIVERKRNFL